MRVISVTSDDKKGMLKLRFDDNSEELIYDEDYYGLGLYDKQEFSAEELDKIKLRTHERLARVLALKMIFARKRTRREVKNRLLEKEILEDSINIALNKRNNRERYI